MPEVVMIGGANGSGKTTFARRLLSPEYPEVTFLNADEIEREGPEHASPLAAAKELLRRIARLEAAFESFAIETTLSSRTYAPRVQAWKDRGYRVSCILSKFRPPTSPSPAWNGA